MEKRYRLKKEARQFFDTMEGTLSEPIDYWKKAGVHTNLLEEVELVYIEYGQKISENGRSLSGHHGPEEKAEFKFTVNLQRVDSHFYDSVNVPEMMDEMQKVLNKYFQ